MQKLIFLDMDGVLNNQNLAHLRRTQKDDIDRTLLCLLVDVINQTKAKVVLSTSWRHNSELVKDIHAAFAEHQLAGAIIGQTPDFECAPRGEEIRQWFMDRELLFDPDVRMAIIDDDDDAGTTWNKAVFFHTNAKDGITRVIADAIIAHLNNNEQPITNVDAVYECIQAAKQYSMDVPARSDEYKHLMLCIDAATEQITDSHRK